MKKLILLIITMYTTISYGAELNTCFESSPAIKITPTISKIRVGLANEQHLGGSYIYFYDNQNRIYDPSDTDMDCVTDREFLKCRLINDGGNVYIQTQHYIILSKNKTIQLRFEGKPVIARVNSTTIRAAVRPDKSSQFNKKSFTLHLIKCDRN